MPTLYIAIGGITFFTALSKYGLTVPVAWRIFRSWIAGRIRPAERPGAARRRVDLAMRPDLYET